MSYVNHAGGDISLWHPRQANTAGKMLNSGHVVNNYNASNHPCRSHINDGMCYFGLLGSLQLVVVMKQVFLKANLAKIKSCVEAEECTPCLFFSCPQISC